MLVRISAADGDEGVPGTLDLYRWLQQDPDVQRHAALSLGPARTDDTTTMGTVEIITTVVGQTFTALNLALSYATWRAARRTAPSVTITVDGRSATVQGDSDEAVRLIVDLLDRRSATPEGTGDTDGQGQPPEGEAEPA